MTTHWFCSILVLRKKYLLTVLPNRITFHEVPVSYWTLTRNLSREAIVQPIIASTWSSSPWQGYQSFQQIIHKSVLWLLQVLRIIGESMKEYQKVRKSPSNYCIGWWYSRQGVRVYYCSASVSTPTADRGTEGVHGISTLCVFVCLHPLKDLRSFWEWELKPVDILWEDFVHFVSIGSNQFS